MKNKVKRIIMSVTILIIAIGMTMIVYADNNYSCVLEVTQDKVSIAPGESVTFELKVKNIQAGNGIAMFMTKIDDDTTNSFDYFDYSVTGDDSNIWAVQGNYDGVITMLRSQGEASSEDSVIAKIIFKAKSTTSVGTYTIKFAKNEFTTDDYETIEIPDITKTIEITSSGSTSEGTNQGGNTSEETEQGGNTSGGTSQGENTSGGTEQGGNTSGGTSQGGNTSGGTSQGGNTSGGTNQGGNTSGGTEQGGNTSEGTSQGENTSGGTEQGGTSQGDEEQGGASQGGSEQGGTSQGDEEQGSNLNEKKQIAADSSNSDSDLPYAGDAGRTIKIIAIAVLSVISILFFVKYRRLNIE